jgi:ABC-type ATPase involved in cell division
MSFLRQGINHGHTTADNQPRWSINLIQFRNVEFGYENQPIFSGLSFHLARGKYMVISGADRSGKTTLVQLIAGSIIPTSGEIYFDDEPMDEIIDSRRRLRKIRRKIGGVGGAFFLLGDRTILENVSLLAEIDGQPYRQARKTAKEACGRYHLSHLLSHFPDQVSEVERRVALLARAEAARKNLIVADGLSDGLDEKSAQFINERLAAMNLSGVSIIYLTSGTGPENGPNQYLRIQEGVLVE